MGKDSQDAADTANSRIKLKKQPSLLDRILRVNKSPPSSDDLSSDESLPPLSTLLLNGYSPHTRHRLLDPELAGEIRNLLPPRLQLYDEWELLYSLEQHGISLNTLYRNCDPDYQQQQLRMRKTGKKDQHGYAENVVNGMVTFGQHERQVGVRPHGYVILVEDEHKHRFGCYINEHPRASDHKRYYGNGECFLWKCELYDDHRTNEDSADHTKKVRRQRFKAFMYTGINDNIVYSNHDFIAVGSSHGQNGLYLDKSLYLGVSYPCETFGNEILNEDANSGHKLGKFKIIHLEVWRVGELE